MLSVVFKLSPVTSTWYISMCMNKKEQGAGYVYYVPYILNFVNYAKSAKAHLAHCALCYFAPYSTSTGQSINFFLVYEYSSCTRTIRYTSVLYILVRVVQNILYSVYLTLPVF